MIRKIIPVFFLIVIFSFLSFKTLPDYGVNWDTYQHMVRGHVYLRYFTTGKKDLPNLTQEVRPSFYQKSPLDWAWTEKMTIGHPPLSDVLMAWTNRILWGKLGLFGDIESHFVYVLFWTVFTAVIIAIWSYIVLGPIASFFSVLSFITLPQLFAEQHFNNKDPLVTAYYTGALFFVWCTVQYKKIWPICIAALFFGLSLGTKFNILFSVFILIPWIISLQWWRVREMRSLFMASCIIIPIVSCLFFYLSYPALWSNIFDKTLAVVSYYITIAQPAQACPYYFATTPWVLFCSDWKTPLLFIVTTPIPTLLLFFIGSIVAWKFAFGKSNVMFLWLLWIILAIIRPTLPVMALYGTSLRQIMEYMVPLSLLVGFAVYYLHGKIKKSTTKILFLVCIFIGYIPIMYVMYRMHPNENVYFNTIIGGLPGAIQYGLDGANNSYGNAYKQGIHWLNANAEKGATISLGAAIASANPTIYYRSDLKVIADVTSLYQQEGEYIIELAYPGMIVGDFFRMRFAKNFLVPTHTVSVDGIVLLSIWKNDPEHTRRDIDLKPESEITVKRVDIDDTLIQLSFPEMRRLKRVEFFYDPVCATTAGDMSLAVSQGHKTPWYRLRGVPVDFMLERADYGADDIYQLAGEYASEVKLYGNPSSGCSLSDIEVKVIVFP